MEGVTEDYNKELESYLARFDFSGLSEDEAREERNRKTAEFLKLYTSKNSAFGTEVEKVANAVYQAMKEGRPVIIDEANSIPAGVLISLNNILNKRPGDTCYVPGASEKGGQVKIQEGFSVIMTGNLSTSSVEYSGVDSDLNPATKSRIKFLKYDYLPQSEEGNLDERDNPEKDELFHDNETLRKQLSELWIKVKLHQ